MQRVHRVPELKHFWYKTDIGKGDDTMGTMCEHKNLTKQGYWVRCVDCGAAHFGEDKEEEWITSRVELIYLDQFAAELEKSINIAKTPPPG